MGTDKKIAAKAWAEALLKTLSTKEILERLDRLRTYYLRCWEMTVEAGITKNTDRYYSFVSRLTTLLAKIEDRQVAADIEIAQTITAYPLMLSETDQIAFDALLEEFGVGVGGPRVC